MLEVDRRACPFVSGPTVVVPIVYVGRRPSFGTVRVDGKRYGLDKRTNAVWYPGEWSGHSRMVQVIPDDHGWQMADLPEMGQTSPFSRGQAHCEVDDTISSLGVLVLSAERIRAMKIVAPPTVRRG